jgi:hypothetical protein
VFELLVGDPARMRFQRDRTRLIDRDLRVAGRPAMGVLAATLSPHGTLVSFAAISEGPMSINPLDVIFKPLTMRGFGWATWQLPAKLAQQSCRRRR